jgi:hypothetical protein
MLVLTSLVLVDDSLLSSELCSLFDSTGTVLARNIVVLMCYVLYSHQFLIASFKT